MHTYLPDSDREHTAPPDESGPLIPDLLGNPDVYPPGVWGFWLRLTIPQPTKGLVPARQRERLRRARLLSALQLAALMLIAVLVPRGFLPVFDPGTVIGIIGFGVLVIISIIVCRSGHVTTASWIFVAGLAAAIAGSQLFTPNGEINFQDLAGYDFLVIPILIAGILLPRIASAYIWLGCALFIVFDLALAPHGPALAAFLPKSSVPILSIYPVAIYPLILTAIVAVISGLAAGSVARALQEADRTTELEEAYALLARQKRDLESAITTIQQVHSRVANGDLTARAPTTSGSLLLSLAVSLNLMLERLSTTTAAQNTLEGLQQQIAWLNNHTLALAQGRIQRPVTQHNMGYLTPIARHLEQLRTSIVQLTQSMAAFAQQIDDLEQTAQLQVQVIERDPHAAGEVIPQLRQTLEREQRHTKRLKSYLQQFGTP
jgi:uncharacterized protein YoxC